jgi:hypothetical protein
MSDRLRLTSTIALALCIAPRAHAQSDHSGRIEGVVFDSVHARPLAGAHIAAVGLGAQSERRADATSDSAGRYHLDSLPIGRYAVGLESELLDSLEVTVSPREANLTAAPVATLDLALPSARTLRSAVCLGVALPPATGVVFGHVVSAESESPLAAVTVAMSWRELGVDRKTLRPIKGVRSDSVVTDANGWYRMCGVPTGTSVSMQLQQQGRTGPVLHAEVDDTLGIAVRHLSFSAPEARADAGTGAARTGEPDAVALSGTSALSGRVLGAEDTPVASAEVRVRGAAGSTRTDAAGRYSLAQLPAGTQVLEVRRFGYEVAELPVELRSGAATTRDVRLRRIIVKLDSMSVVATRSRYPEFQRRREHLMYGIFLGPEEMTRQHVAFTSDIVEKNPAFRVIGTGPNAVVVNNRGVIFSNQCASNIVIDDVEHRSINEIHPADIGAMELYPAFGIGDLAPGMVDKGCGAIVIWTKR